MQTGWRCVTAVPDREVPQGRDKAASSSRAFLRRAVSGSQRCMRKTGAYFTVGLRHCGAAVQCLEGLCRQRRTSEKGTSVHS